MEGQGGGRDTEDTTRIRTPLTCRPYASASRDSIPPVSGGGRHPPPPRMQLPAKCLGLCFRKSPTWRIAHRGLYLFILLYRTKTSGWSQGVIEQTPCTEHAGERRPPVDWESRTSRAHNDGKQKPVAQTKPHRIEHFNT